MSHFKMATEKHHNHTESEIVSENLPRLGSDLTTIFHLARWRSKADWNIKILILAG